jgi:hypothetical protein
LRTQIVLRFSKSRIESLDKDNSLNTRLVSTLYLIPQIQYPPVLHLRWRSYGILCVGIHK